VVRTRPKITAVAAVLVLVAAPVAAQDQQAEIEALRQQLEALQQRIDELETRQQETVQQLEEVPQPTIETERADRGARVVLAGRINQALLYATQDDQDQLFIADNDASGSRFEFLAESDFGEFTSGVEIVVSAEVNSTDEIDFGSTLGSIDDGNALGDFRQAHWYVEHPRFGYFSIGQGDTAAEDTAHVDLSGTSFAGAGSDVDDIAGGLGFISEEPYIDADGASTRELTELDDFFDMQDGDRALRVIYNTPRWRGFAASASFQNNDVGDGVSPNVAATYAGTLSGVDVEGAVSYRRDETEDEDLDVFVGSASTLLPSGWNFTLAGSYAIRDVVNDSTAIFGKVGYIREFFDFGETRFSLDAYRGKNAPADFAAADGDLPTALGVGLFAVQEVYELGTEFYLGGRMYSLDDVFAPTATGQSEVDVENLWAFITGARVRF
jgi:type II secretory pathway pseudopilin PulG